MAVTAPFAAIYAKIKKRRFIFSFAIIRLNIRRCKITKNFLKGANSVAKRMGFCYNIKARGRFPALGIRGARYSLPPSPIVAACKNSDFFAGVAELADALDSGSNGCKTVQVQVLSPAPDQARLEP